MSVRSTGTNRSRSLTFPTLTFFSTFAGPAVCERTKSSQRSHYFWERGCWSATPPPATNHTCKSRSKTSGSGRRRIRHFYTAKSVGSGSAGREVFGTPKGF